jgi:hypothetical protein
MSKPDPKVPGEGPESPAEDEHGAKLAKLFREIEEDMPEPVGD